jgi:hypothetical protein
MTSPVPGFSAPSPRTWALGDLLTAARLRGDMTNLAALYCSARPMLVVYSGSQNLGSGAQSLMEFSSLTVNNWNVDVLNPAGNNAYFAPPLAGWYLVQGDVIITPPGTTPEYYKYGMGFRAVINGAGAVTFDGGAVPATAYTGASPKAGPTGADLYQFNPATSDTLAFYGFQNSGGTLASFGVLTAEWVALPTSGLTDYSGPYGTKVASPAAPAAWPSGPGTYITNSGGIAAGATSMTVSDATGMVTGGYLGLDYINGQLYQPVGEVVTISSVSGTTIGISATSFAHLQDAPVAVPYSPAFLNQQVRDAVNFLAYPPVLRAISSTTQAIGSTGFPPTVSGDPSNQITTLGTTTIDNFGGFSGSGTYTVPVSGVYLVYGQIYYAGSTTGFGVAAGISVSGGTIQWGTTTKANTASVTQSLCITVRRQLRLTAEQTVTLWAFQSSGSNMNTVSSGSDVSRLICIWRSF